MTLNELRLIKRIINEDNPTKEEYQQAIQAIEREIQLRIMNPIKSKEDDQNRMVRDSSQP
jgi:hypothetical protein